ncbi:MAG: hypothetical protein R3C68_05465 [Myxococcota bacterium]
MRHLILCLIFFGAPLYAATDRVTCKDPVSGKEATLRVKKVTNALKSVRAEFARRGLHMIDFSQEIHEHQRRLPIDQAARAWCKVDAHTRAFLQALRGVVVDEMFGDRQILAG